MIVLTGAAGFIGSNLIEKLNRQGVSDLMLVDDFSKKQKELNFMSKRFTALIDRVTLMDWLKEDHPIDLVLHIGARTDTTEFDRKIFEELNVNYSKNLWNFCTKKGIPFIYASSAATYGNGEHGYSDSHSIVSKLSPLNPYGDSKNDFDKWALQQTKYPPYWAGLKFFNVYGPNEYHKGRMASVIMHTFNQIKETGKMKLFRSHNPNFKDGEQLRDFIYVNDVVDVIWFLMNHKKHSGLYNLGTGRARSFNDLAKATFRALGLDPVIDYIDTPLDIRDKYQYFTEADMNKLKNEGYAVPFSSLEQGVEDYVCNYLSVGKYK